MNVEQLQHIDSLILRARRRVRLTQAQLAVKAGLSIATVSLAERFGVVTDRTLERLAAALGVDAKELRP
jgi:transcriptional regulator with XRE-family HTH domain